MNIYQITWRDSRRYVYQLDHTIEDFSVCQIQTIGFFVEEDKEKIVLAQDLIDDEVRGVIVIPKENIVKKRVIKPY